MASVCAVALMGVAHADTFVNGSFETGDLTGWTVGGGYWYAPPYPQAVDYLPGGGSYNPAGAAVSVTSAGTDPYTDNNLSTVYAGAHSARVNDPNNNYSVSVLSQRVNNYTDPLIAFAYAAVLQSSHSANDSDAFSITLTDATTNTVLFTYNLNSATSAGAFTRSSQNWYYTPWISQSVDVSALEGHDFILSLVANDCPYGGHAGYAYLDGFGSVIGGGGTGGGPTAVYWDGPNATNANNNVVDGGAGVWDVTNINFTDSTGATNTVQAPSVIFAGQPGVVTVDDVPGAVSVSGLQFAVDGYVITGDAIGLSGANVTIQVGDNTPGGADYTATIDSVLTGTSALTKTDLGTLILNGVNTYSGGTTVSGGTLVGSSTSFGTGDIADNAALVFDQPSAGVFAAVISGTGALAKRGAGTLDLTGISTLTGATTVEAGRLQVDGSLAASAVTVQNGGTLGGSGIVGDVTVTSGGTVAPGAGSATATLQVVNNYDQDTGSVLHVNANTAGGSDQVLISGDATVDAGAQLHLSRTGVGHFILGTRYTVLTANGEGGLSGRFTLSGDTHVSLFVDVVDHYDFGHAYLDVTQTHSFASVGQTPNQIAAAGGADIGSGPLFNAIVYLQTAPEARAAFDAISGEVHASVKGAGLEDSRFIREAVFDRLRGSTPDSAGKGLWGRGFGSWGHADGDGNAASYTRDIGGFFMGLDAGTDGHLRGGLVGGYSHSSVNIADRSSHASTDDYHLGAYGGVQQGPVGLRAGASYTWRRVITDRTVAFTGFSDNVNAAYNADVGQLFGELGYTVKYGHDSFEPFVNVAWVDLHTNDLAEVGGAAAVTGKADSVTAIFTTVGTRAKTSFTLGNGIPVTAHGLAGWRHADGTMTPTSTLAFAGGSDFSVAGIPVARDALAIEAGLEAELSKRAEFDVSYSGQVGSRVSDHGVKATLSWKF